MNGVIHVLQRLDSWMLTLLGLALVGCGSTNTVLDATSLYTRGENQSALDVLSEAKSNSKNQQWATLQEVTVALDASQFERAARAVSWVEARDELIDERALISGTEVKEDLGSALIDERLRAWTPSLGERVMYEYLALMIDLLRGDADQARVSSIRIARSQTLLEERRRMPSTQKLRSKRKNANEVAGQIDREASYQRAIEVYAGAAEDARCAAGSLLAGWARLQLGDAAARALLEEAAALAPEHDAARRLLDMDSEALSQTALVFQEDGLCPTLRPFRFNIHTWQTGVARVALPIPVLRTSQALGAVGSGSGDLLQVVSDVDALYLAEELDRAPARLLRTATRLLSQEVATRSVMREIDDQGSLARGMTRLSASLLRTVLVDADVRSWDTRPSVIRAGLIMKSPEGSIQLNLPEGLRTLELPPGPNFVRIRTRAGIPTVIQTSPYGLFGAQTEPINPVPKGTDP